MTARNAQQLLGEVNDLVNELQVNFGQKKSFFDSLKKLEKEYDLGKLSYLSYEEKLNSLLHGRSRDEWVSYYAACIYSLTKKVEFIILQAIALVQDDNSASSIVLKGNKPPFQKETKATANGSSSPSSVPVAAASHVEVFNIDNEIQRLKTLFEARNVGKEKIDQVKELEKPLKASRLEQVIPKIEEIAKELEESEEKGLKSRLTQKVKPQPVLVEPQPVLFEPRPLQKAAAVKKKHSIPNPFKPMLFLARAVVAIPVGVLKSAKRVAFKPKSKAPEFYKPVEAKMPSKLPKPKSASFAPQKASVFSALKGVFSSQKKKEGIFVEEIVAMEKRAKVTEAAPVLEKKEPAGLAFGWFSIKGLLGEVTEKFRSKQEPILGQTTAIPIHVKKLKEMRRKIYEEERLSGFDTTLLAQEARRVKKILEVERPEVYQGSSVGLIANITVRKISLFLVDTFPEFFGFLYNGLRAANVKVLSNTYVNIMILSTMFVSACSFFMLTLFFFVVGYPIYQILLRSVIFSMLAGFASATIFYAYPFMRIKDRKRKIMTNMPFAINHMAAVATSGVPPVSMFELIAASREYSEIGTELKKIVDFINIFGYDLLTALRTVGATTPSPPFKEFLEGMVSTIETGGDLDRYLRQEADQATLTYNLERQRYNETVSTYSDIYTGLLIAAPLFFVSAMAMVNLLGGTLGGIGVDVVMAVGAYAIIPLLNIGFILFLQFTQPDV